MRIAFGNQFGNAILDPNASADDSRMRRRL
jgi:hypothetical protein